MQISCQYSYYIHGTNRSSFQSFQILEMANVIFHHLHNKTEIWGWKWSDSSSTDFHFGFEQVDHLYWHDVISSNWKLPGYIGASYILLIFGLQWWMKDRQALKLKWPLFWWNLSLGIFSIFGFARTLPGFLDALGKEDGFYHSICSKRDLDVATAYWLILFAFSKYVELGDTLFIVLRKRPLIFLQWYHHLVTMSVTWILSPLVEPIVRCFTVLNFGVHSLMYPYFAMRASGIRVPTGFANVITTLQFAQMIYGLGINISSMMYQKSGYDCARYPLSIQLFSLVYGSFLFLFGKLFYNSVIKRKAKRGGAGFGKKKIE